MTNSEATPPAQGTIAVCAMCKTNSKTYVLPLHGEKGGPLCCPFCIGKWHGEHGRKRRAGRVVIRAMQVFFNAGGKWADIDKMRFATMGWDQLGYMNGLSMDAEENVDITSELLTDVLNLTHPDHHPLERKEAATRVTGDLLKLKPFVFPAPKPKPKPKAAPQPQKRDEDDKLSKLISGIKAYPCTDCVDTAPHFYCTTCRAEYDKRKKQEFDKRTAKQRAEYARRRQRQLSKRKPKQCASCGKEFESKRLDALFCSARCRQAIHRKGVTDKSSRCAETDFAVTNNVTDKQRADRAPLSIRDARNLILAALKLHDAVFLNDILPRRGRTKAQYQALCKAARQLEDAGAISSRSWWSRFARPGFRALTRRYYEPKDSDKIIRLTSEQRAAIRDEADKANETITDKQSDDRVTELSVTADPRTAGAGNQAPVSAAV